MPGFSLQVLNFNLPCTSYILVSLYSCDVCVDRLKVFQEKGLAKMDAVMDRLDQGESLVERQTVAMERQAAASEAQTAVAQDLAASFARQASALELLAETIAQGKYCSWQKISLGTLHFGCLPCLIAGEKRVSLWRS